VSVSLSFASGNMQKIENDLAPACDPLSVSACEAFLRFSLLGTPRFSRDRRAPEDAHPARAAGISEARGD
jgi:hypothetical protein